MKNPATARKAARNRGPTPSLPHRVFSPSMLELKFREFCKQRGLPISFRGNGRLWINRRNPDFRVIGQKKVIEITSDAIFNGWKREPRANETYAVPTVDHYAKSGWQCLVIYWRDHRRQMPESLADTVRDFASPGSTWRGIWRSGRLTQL